MIQMCGLAEDSHFGPSVGFFAFNKAMMT